MGRVLVISGAYYVEYATRDLGIVRELQRRGHAVEHVVVAEEIPPPYPRQAVEADPEFRALGSLWVRQLADVLPYLARCEVLLIPVNKGVRPVSEWAHQLGKVVVEHMNHGGFDCYYYDADLVAAKGPYFANFMREKWGLSEEVVVSTGCVQYDAAARPEFREFPRDEFCRMYGLDPAKRIAVWLPTREDRQHWYYEWSIAKYREICEIITRSTNHNLIIKPHPGDFAGPYRDPGPGPHWWESVFPGAAVCQPEHSNACFHLCDVGIANWSSTGLEFAVFRKPFLYVDVAENPRLKFLREQTDLEQPIGFYKGTLVPGFVGDVCTSAELPEILETCSYKITDESLYDEHIARFLYKADGRAYERVADMVERGLALAAARPRRVRPGALAGVRLRVRASQTRQQLSRLRHRLSTVNDKAGDV